MNCEERQNMDIICNMLERSNFEINKKDILKENYYIEAYKR